MRRIETLNKFKKTNDLYNFKIKTNFVKNQNTPSFIKSHSHFSHKKCEWHKTHSPIYFTKLSNELQDFYTTFSKNLPHK